MLIHHDQMEHRYSKIDTNDVHEILLAEFHPRIVSRSRQSMRRTISLRLELVGLRQDVAFVMSEFAYSERQACKLMSMDRTTYRYQPRPDHNAELRSKLIALARQKPRYGSGVCVRCWSAADAKPPRNGCTAYPLSGAPRIQ